MGGPEAGALSPGLDAGDASDDNDESDEALLAGHARSDARTAPKNLWFVAGKAYDLTAFVAKHPGGRDALLLGKGTNCTELFASYHFTAQKQARLMARYEVPVDQTDPQAVELAGHSRFTFADDDFYKIVKKRVADHFRKSRTKPGASIAVQVLSLLAILGVVALTYPAYVRGSLVAAGALAVLRALTAVGPGHSMSHFSLFPRGRWNALVFRLGSPFLVSSWPIWSNSHVRSHHVDTLTPDDLQDNYPLKRIQPGLAHRPWHRGQPVYSWIVYALGLPLWSLQDFVLAIKSLFTGRHLVNQISLRDRVENVIAIGLNLVLSVALPFFFLPWKRAALVCVVVNVVSSLMVVIQIVVNHEVPETMERSSGDGVDWGRHQVLTSHNFGVDSSIALHMSGGLNMQIEHHLFPGVHYTHFPQISKIVREACVEFQLPYNTSSHVFEAMAKHQRLLRLNSVPPPVAHAGTA